MLILLLLATMEREAPITRGSLRISKTKLRPTECRGEGMGGLIIHYTPNFAFFPLFLTDLFRRSGYYKAPAECSRGIREN